MSTTNQRQSRHHGTAIVQFDAVKRRRRVENLLYTRKRVAHLAAEHRSHGLDDAVELYLLQLQVEQTIADEFPEVFEEVVGDWAEEEAAGEHHPLVTAETCSLCQAIAKHDDGGSDTPLAA